MTRATGSTFSHRGNGKLATSCKWCHRSDHFRNTSEQGVGGLSSRGSAQVLAHENYHPRPKRLGKLLPATRGLTRRAPRAGQPEGRSGTTYDEVGAENRRGLIVVAVAVPSFMETCNSLSMFEKCTKDSCRNLTSHCIIFMSKLRDSPCKR
mmetsp:Transcript_25363/g.57629  ORF Transcript_25363/g.57629 Transcript_25363/m.57629 type:complete len:151 (-) Transcript_25363:190-642(-)